MMKPKLLSLLILGLIPIAVALTSCSRDQGSGEVTVVRTPDGVLVVDTLTNTATVTGIDAEKRKVTLVTPEGHKTTYKAGPEVVNFDQIQLGDQVKTVVTEQALVSMAAGEGRGTSASSTVELAPVGSKPGVVRVNTFSTTAKVSAVDTDKGKVTFQLPDGTTKTVKAGKQVDLSAMKVGDSVTAQISEGLMITVEKP